MRPVIWDLVTGERTDVRVELPGEIVPIDWWPDAARSWSRTCSSAGRSCTGWSSASGTLTEISASARRDPRRPCTPGRLRLARASSGDEASRLLDDVGNCPPRARALGPAHRRAVPRVAVPQPGRRPGARLAGRPRGRGPVPRLPEGARRAELALRGHVVAGRADARRRGVPGRDGELSRLDGVRREVARPHHRQHRLPRGPRTPLRASTT